jgi:hypothetical protein
MGTYINPLDLRTLFIDYFLGSTELFIFAFVILLSATAAKFNMSNRIFMTLLAIGSIIFSGLLGNAVYLLVIFLIGISTFKGVERIIQGA